MCGGGVRWRGWWWRKRYEENNDTKAGDEFFKFFVGSPSPPNLSLIFHTCNGPKGHGEFCCEQDGDFIGKIIKHVLCLPQFLLQLTKPKQKKKKNFKTCPLLRENYQICNIVISVLCQHYKCSITFPLHNSFPEPFL